MALPERGQKDGGTAPAHEFTASCLQLALQSFDTVQKLLKVRWTRSSVCWPVEEMPQPAVSEGRGKVAGGP